LQPFKEMNITLRKARKEDMPHVLALIKELAAYERAPNEVEVTIEELERDGFSAHPVFWAILAEYDEQVVGMALYYIKYSTWKGKCVFLEDIIVTEKHRGKGVGGMLFAAVVEAIKPLKVRRLEWQVLEWNETAINFYKKYNSHFDPEWLNCKLTENQIQEFSIPNPYP